MKYPSLRTSLVALGFMLALAGTAWANGEDFFVPAAADGPIDLVYAGQIRDKSTGRLITDTVSITIAARNLGLEFPFEGDTPGHYRSPDIGAYIKQLSPNTVTVDPKELDITLFVPGYKTEVLTKLPRKASGVVDVSFQLEPDGGTLGADGKVVANNTRPLPGGQPLPDHDQQNRMIQLVTVGCVVTIMVGGVARTVGRRRSTAD